MKLYLDCLDDLDNRNDSHLKMLKYQFSQELVDKHSVLNWTKYYSHMKVYIGDSGKFYVSIKTKEETAGDKRWIEHWYVYDESMKIFNEDQYIIVDYEKESI